MKKILSLIIILLIANCVFAQKKSKKDTINPAQVGMFVQADLGFGNNTLVYNMSNYGKTITGIGGNFRLGYRYFFAKNWGAGLNLTFSSFHSGAKCNYTQTIDDAIDDDNQLYQHRTKFNFLKEVQNGFMLSMPIAGFYQFDYDRKYKVCVGFGPSINMIFSNKFSTKSGTMQTTAYYPDYHAELFGLIKHHQFTAKDFSGSYKNKTSVGIYGEIQGMYSLNKQMELCLGMFFNYGVSNIKKQTANYQYDPDYQNLYERANYNGILNCQIVPKVHPFTIGLLAGVRYRFNTPVKHIDEGEIIFVPDPDNPGKMIRIRQK